MKIHYLTLTLDEGYGGFRVICNVLNGLANKGHDIAITTILPSPKPFDIHKKIKFSPVKYSKLNYQFLGTCRILRAISAYDVDGYAAINKFISKQIPDCDVNIAHSYRDVFPVYESCKGVPVHYMQHDEVLISSDKHVKMVGSEAYSLPIKRTVNSLWLKQRMKENYNLELPLVNPAIDHSIFHPYPVDRNDDKHIVMCFARQQDWKGFQDAIAAMKIVKKSVDRIEFRVFGRKEVAINEPFSYTFYKNPTDQQLAELYSSSDLSICPSWFESFPLPPIESMACGCPTVTTRYGTEDYAFNEQNALVVPPRNPQLMADAIIRLLKEEGLREKFRKNGPITAKEFTWQKTVDRVEEIFEQFRINSSEYNKKIENFSRIDF